MTKNQLVGLALLLIVVFVLGVKAATAESVAKCGYDAMMKKDLVKINEKPLNFMVNWVMPFMPRKTLLNVSQQFMEKK